MSQKAIIYKGVTFLALIALYITCHLYLLSPPLAISRAHKSEMARWTISPYILKAVAGEFNGLFANLLVMEAGARMADPNIPDKEKDWDSIIRLFHQITQLDPYFQQTYFLAQGWIPWIGRNPEEIKRYTLETNKILATAGKHRTLDWCPPYLIGFNSYYFFNDYAAAGKRMIEAGMLPDAPGFLPILGARLSLQGGDTPTAIFLLKTMLAQRDIFDPDYQSIHDRLTAMEGVYKLEAAVKEYVSRYGKKPKNLSELTRKKILQELPINPYSDSYCITEEGKIFFDSVNCLKQSKYGQKTTGQN